MVIDAPKEKRFKVQGSKGSKGSGGGFAAF
jgi:hypothetical protein